MNIPKNLDDFPAETKWIQLTGGAIAIMPNGRVFRVSKEGILELQERRTKRKQESKPA